MDKNNLLNKAQKNSIRKKLKIYNHKQITEGYPSKNSKILNKITNFQL